MHKDNTYFISGANDKQLADNSHSFVFKMTTATTITMLIFFFFLLFSGGLSAECCVRFYNRHIENVRIEESYRPYSLYVFGTGGACGVIVAIVLLINFCMECFSNNHNNISETEADIQLSTIYSMTEANKNPVIDEEANESDVKVNRPNTSTSKGVVD